MSSKCAHWANHFPVNVCVNTCSLTQFDVESDAFNDIDHITHQNDIKLSCWLSDSNSLTVTVIAAVWVWEMFLCVFCWCDLTAVLLSSLLWEVVGTDAVDNFQWCRWVMWLLGRTETAVQLNIFESCQKHWIFSFQGLTSLWKVDASTAMRCC